MKLIENSVDVEKLQTSISHADLDCKMTSCDTVLVNGQLSKEERLTENAVKMPTLSNGIHEKNEGSTKNNGNVNRYFEDISDDDYQLVLESSSDEGGSPVKKVDEDTISAPQIVQEIEDLLGIDSSSKVIQEELKEFSSESVILNEKDCEGRITTNGELTIKIPQEIQDVFEEKTENDVDSSNKKKAQVRENKETKKTDGCTSSEGNECDPSSNMHVVFDEVEIGTDNLESQANELVTTVNESKNHVEFVSKSNNALNQPVVDSKKNIVKVVKSTKENMSSDTAEPSSATMVNQDILIKSQNTKIDTEVGKSAEIVKCVMQANSSEHGQESDDLPLTQTSSVSDTSIEWTVLDSVETSDDDLRLESSHDNIITQPEKCEIKNSVNNTEAKDIFVEDYIKSEDTKNTATLAEGEILRKRPASISEEETERKKIKLKNEKEDLKLRTTVAYKRTSIESEGVHGTKRSKYSSSDLNLALSTDKNAETIVNKKLECIETEFENNIAKKINETCDKSDILASSVEPTNNQEISELINKITTNTNLATSIKEGVTTKTTTAVELDSSTKNVNSEIISDKSSIEVGINMNKTLDLHKLEEKTQGDDLVIKDGEQQSSITEFVCNVTENISSKVVALEKMQTFEKDLVGMEGKLSSSVKSVSELSFEDSTKGTPLNKMEKVKDGLIIKYGKQTRAVSQVSLKDSLEGDILEQTETNLIIKDDNKTSMASKVSADDSLKEKLTENIQTEDNLTRQDANKTNIVSKVSVDSSKRGIEENSQRCKDNTSIKDVIVSKISVVDSSKEKCLENTQRSKASLAVKDSNQTSLNKCVSNVLVDDPSKVAQTKCEKTLSDEASTLCKKLQTEIENNRSSSFKNLVEETGEVKKQTNEVCILNKSKITDEIQEEIEVKDKKTSKLQNSSRKDAKEVIKKIDESKLKLDLVPDSVNTQNTTEKENLENLKVNDNDAVSKFKQCNKDSSSSLEIKKEKNIKKTNEVTKETASIERKSPFNLLTKHMQQQYTEIKKSSNLDKAIERVVEKSRSDSQRMLPLLKKFHKEQLKKMTRSDLEEAVVLKICEAVTDRSEIGQMRLRCQSLEQNCELWRKKAMQLEKQNREMEMLLKKYLTEVAQIKRDKEDKMAYPIKVTRSVGLQVVLASSMHGTLLSSKPRLNTDSLQNERTRVNNQQQQQQQQQKQLQQQQQHQQQQEKQQHQAITKSTKIEEESRKDVVKATTFIPPVQSTTRGRGRPPKSSLSSSPSTSTQSTPLPSPSKATPPGTPVKTSVTTKKITSSGKDLEVIDLTEKEEKAKVQQTSVGGAIRVAPTSQVCFVQQSPKITTPAQTPMAYIVQKPGQRQQYLVTTSSSPPRPVGTVSHRPPPALALPVFRSAGQIIPVQNNSQVGVRNTSNTSATQQVSQALRVSSQVPMLKHPAPLPAARVLPPNIPGSKLPPPKPQLKIAKTVNGIMLSWSMTLTKELADMASYQLYAYQEGSQPPSTNIWKKVGDVKALPLPMACTLTQFVEGHKYHFAVRAVDVHGRVGPFSSPGSILLTK